MDLYPRSNYVFLFVMFKERCYIFCDAAFYFGFLLILNKFLLMEVYIKLKT
jgi:hypothetical protein